jgi:general secretion pathway protein E
MLPLCAEIQKLVVKDAELAKIKALAQREGMKPLRLSGAEKVAAGLTTAEEIIKIAPPMDYSAVAK